MKIIKYFFEAILIYIFFLLFRIVGINYARKISSFLLNRLGFLFKKKKTVENNILKVFKNPSTKEIENIIELMWKNYGFVFAEYIYLNKFRLDKFSDNHIKISGENILDEILKKNKPVIFVSGHFANYELMAMELEKRGIDLAAIYRPLNNIFLNPFMVYLR